MEIKSPLESIGWLSSMGYQVVVDEEAKQTAEEKRNSPPLKKEVQVQVEDNKASENLRFSRARELC